MSIIKKKKFTDLAPELPSGKLAPRQQIVKKLLLVSLSKKFQKEIADQFRPTLGPPQGMAGKWSPK